MTDFDCAAFDAESLEDFFEPTVEIPAALLLAGCCCGCGAARAAVHGRCC
jgi:hypothetical protein